MNETVDSETLFVETREYLRFAEFCDACRQYRYIGLCHGPPGVGKTLSARKYSGVEHTGESIFPQAYDGDFTVESEVKKTVFYTVPVINTPRIIEQGIEVCREQLHQLILDPLDREKEAALQTVYARERELKKELEEMLLNHDWISGLPPKCPATDQNMGELVESFRKKRRMITDPTNLILIDEADRLTLSGLETVRAIFDKGGIGLVLIGMPGIEKRLARYPQFYSRIGFVHGFRSLGAADVRDLMAGGWMPPEIILPPIEEEALAAIIRITGGNFRLLDRLLSQTGRIVRLNDLASVTAEAVNAARESLVIGQG